MASKTILLLAAVIPALAAVSEFEVASVKANRSGSDHSSTNISRDSDAMKLTMENVSLLQCLQRAYDVKGYQILGPDWLKSEKYDVIGTVPERLKAEELQPLLQKLLSERFQIKLHRETRVLPIYELVVAKSGLKIKAVEVEGQTGTWDGVGRLTAKNETLPKFAEVLSRKIDRPVVDRTGVEGAFNFTLEYEQEGPSIFTALQETLGLKLEAKKGPVEMLVIDTAERVPAGN